jgi:hypothetical protein
LYRSLWALLRLRALFAIITLIEKFRASLYLLMRLSRACCAFGLGANLHSNRQG